MDEEEGKNPDILLVERACIYLTRGEYPPSASDNVKRSIRRKAKKLRVRNGEIFYVHRNGQEVYSYRAIAICNLLVQQCIQSL